MSLASTRPLNTKTLLSDLQKLVRKLEDDLRERSEMAPDVRDKLRSEWDKERSAGHTASTYEAWRDDYLTQVAVAWVLACVFVRWMEDNHFLTEVYLAGEGARMNRAHETHDEYFNTHPTDSDKDYLLHVFATVGKLPACQDLLGKEHNALWRVAISADAGKLLLAFWQATNPDTQELLRVFESPTRDTRFLGDLYQDLSEAARKKYALLQTPEFVEEFILDRTLEPAIREFGLSEVRMIDPTCGSGHFVLGAFRRIHDHWHREAPGMSTTERVIKSLQAVAGVDLNPFAVAIARFRLLVAALAACKVGRMKDAPDFHMNLATGDSLLHGRRFDRTGQFTFDKEQEHWLPDAFSAEDFEQATEILSRQYHVVVGNPPYITDKDEAHREYVRKQYESCYQKFSLGVPFTERFFGLARAGDGNGEAGFVGMITAHSFMKREFGKKLIESYLPKVDLTHVIDTSGAYIPGHGTPTVMLFGRNRRSRLGTVRAVMGIRGEPSTPEVPAEGKVWQAILRQVDVPGSTSPFVSVSDTERMAFERHPWSIGGGGSAELLGRVEAAASYLLGTKCSNIGYCIITGLDEVLLLPKHVADKTGLPYRDLCRGDEIRDWAIRSEQVAVWPNTVQGQRLEAANVPRLLKFLWPWKRELSERRVFGHPIAAREIPWWAIQEVYTHRLATPLAIAFAFFSTHNNFVLDQGGRLFNRSAPIVKLSPKAIRDDYLALVAVLNSSTGCFWLHQVCHNKGAGADQANARQTSEAFDNFYEISGTQLARFPIVQSAAVTSYARQLDSLAHELRKVSPDSVLNSLSPSFESQLEAAQVTDQEIIATMVALQEELDWATYAAYGLLSPEDQALLSSVERPAIPGPLRTGHRPFEHLLWLRIQQGEDSSAWFERIGASTPEVTSPSSLTLARMQVIQRNPEVALIEQPEHKRRWVQTPWSERMEAALRGWLIDHLETPTFWTDPTLTTCARLADQARQDTDFMQVAALYRKTDDFEVTKLVTELVLSESVPYLPAFRYTESGLSKRQQWEDTWTLQRREDAGESVGKIPIPPKYGNTDLQKTEYWRLRGKLDVPKERFVLYPLAERETDPSPVITWAGFDHKQQAQALASYYTQMRDDEGWPDTRLEPLLGGLLELLPWLKQWHNDIDPETRVRLGDFYEGFLQEEARRLGKTLTDIRAWTPPKTARAPRKPRTR